MAALLSRPQASGNVQRLAVQMDIKHSAGWSQRSALVDSGASLNVVSHLLAKELDLPVDTTPTPRVNTLGGHALQTFGNRKATIALRDSQGRRLESEESFLAADISGYDAILGYP